MALLIGYGEAVGIFDIWQLKRLKEKVSFEEVVLFARRRPTVRVIREAQEVGIEIRTAQDPKGEAKGLAERLRRGGREVKVKALEELADRSIMRDVF